MVEENPYKGKSFKELVDSLKQERIVAFASGDELSLAEYVEDIRVALTQNTESAEHNLREFGVSDIEDRLNKLGVAISKVMNQEPLNPSDRVVMHKAPETIDALIHHREHSANIYKEEVNPNHPLRLHYEQQEGRDREDISADAANQMYRDIEGAAQLRNIKQLIIALKELLPERGNGRSFP